MNNSKSRRNEYVNTWRKKNINRVIYTTTKSRAKKLGIPFDLTIDDIIIPTHCPILGIELYRNEGKHGSNNNSPSIDRIIPSRGYVKGNISIISSRANAIKSNTTIQELEKILEYARGN